MSSLKRQGAPRGTPQQTTRLRFIWRPPYDRVVQKSSLWRPIRAKSCMAGAIRGRIGRRKTKEGKHEGEKVARRWSGRAGETEQARGRPTSERESKRGIGSRSSLARAAAFPPLPWEVAAYPPAADPCSRVLFPLKNSFPLWSSFARSSRLRTAATSQSALTYRREGSKRRREGFGRELRRR